MLSALFSSPVNWGRSIHVSGLFGALNSKYTHGLCCCLWLLMWWAKTTETRSLTVLEAGSLRSRCQRDRAPGEGSRGESFLTPSSFRWLLAVLGLWSHHSCLCCSLHAASSLRLWVSFSVSYNDTLIGLGLTLICYNLTSILVICSSAKTPFPNEVPF